jgi:hypothetical protein
MNHELIALAAAARRLVDADEKARWHGQSQSLAQQFARKKLKALLEEFGMAYRPDRADLSLRRRRAVVAQQLPDVHRVFRIRARQCRTLRSREGAVMSVWVSRTLILAPIYIGLCVTEATYKREMKRLKVPPDQWPDWVTAGSDGTTHFFDCRDEELALVCVRAGNGRDRAEMYGLLVHEAMHVWRRCLERLNERHPSSEFEAYSMQAISQQLFHAYEDQMKAKRGRTKR